MDLSHLAARTHERVSTDCEEAEAEIKRLTEQVMIAENTLRFILEQHDSGNASSALAAVWAEDALIQMSVVE